jgi:hypothetical protein
MVIIGLLLIALICLVLGLMLQSAVWLIASLIATGGAGYLLYRLRDVIAAPKQHRPVEDLGPDENAKAPTVAPAAGAPAASDAADSAPTDDYPPEFDEDVALAGDEIDDEVWVIDGRPRYHLGHCAIIKGQDAEPIPYDQATEDGFMPCSLCEPHAERTR